jgi:glycine/D-amino acid oxidase-like deaminating enzyme
MNASTSTATPAATGPIASGYDNTLHEIMRLMEGITADIESKSLEEQVEIGALLHDLAGRTNKRLGVVKTTLREKIEADGVVLGTKHYDGLLNGTATVTCAKPKMVLGKNADVDLLKTVLGDSFGAFFTEKVSYTVKDTEGIAKTRRA